MCSGRRIQHLCPCVISDCPYHDHKLRHRGHVLWTELDHTGWVYCTWWFVNGPQHLVMNRFVKPDCKHFKWDDIYERGAKTCFDCQIICEPKIGKPF
jgi:hypothetical protein